MASPKGREVIELSEAQVKRGVTDYLEIMQAQGRLVYFRLNAGDFIEVRGNTRRRIKGAPKGTADLIVIQGGEVQMVHYNQIEKTHPVTFVTFIECKSSKGKTSKEQDEFAEQVKKLHCRYQIVRSVDDLMEVLKRD